MKPRHLLFFLGVFFFVFNALNAQKLRDKFIDIKYVKLPEKQLPPDHKTYSVTVGGPLFTYVRGGTPQAFGNSIAMDGFKRVEGVGANAGHLRTTVYGGAVYVGDIVAKTRESKYKDKEGNEKVRYYYFYEVPVRNMSTFKVYNPDGEILERGEISSTDVLKSEERRDAKERSANRAADIEKVQEEYASSIISNLRSRINAGLVNTFDYANRSDRFNLYLIKGTHDESLWENHHEEVKGIFRNAEATESSSVLKESLASALSFYELEASKNPRNNKKLKRIYKAANYNLALLHYAVDEFDTARMYTSKVIRAENKDRRSRLLNDKMDRWESKMEAMNINTIHYKRDLSDALPPSAIADLEAVRNEIEENTTTSNGSIFYGDDEQKGTWSLDKEARDIVFGKGGNVSFLVDEGTEINEINLMDPNVTSFVIADRKFEKRRFTPSAKGDSEASIEILETIYKSDRIKLYKYYPSSGALSDEKPEFAFQKTGQEHPLSLESTMFLIWNKGLSEYFSDCKDLTDMIDKGGIEKTKDSLIKAARIYSELCNNTIKP